MFLAALSFAYFAKALSGSYMKSTITQLERRFDIPSYLIGIIDGSFEIGTCFSDFMSVCKAHTSWISDYWCWLLLHVGRIHNWLSVLRNWWVLRWHPVYCAGLYIVTTRKSHRYSMKTSLVMIKWNRQMIKNSWKLLAVMNSLWFLWWFLNFHSKKPH